MNTPFVPFINPPVTLIEPATWFLFQGFQLLLKVDDTAVTLPTACTPNDLPVAVTHVNYLGFLEGEPRQHCFAAEIDEAAPLPDGWQTVNLRGVYGRIPNKLFWVAARAVQIVEWDRTHQFCGRCATPLKTTPNERAKVCPACGLTQYPRLSPAVIVRVTRVTPHGEEILLAHNARFPHGFYSVLAGFVEPGETLEDCVRREIWEEVGIEVQNIRYFGSQPWPFPHSLMVAFTAEYANGRITVDQVEIENAKWFTADTLPKIPPKLSIARQLIDDFVRQQGKQVNDR
ncbi:MAG: NAD(+) diphosphatase [Candidatus Promineifilaceae bacterium]